ncbi:MAG: 4,5-DOPA dioxygenase extradiol, partial [Sulfitobacter sp.]
DRGVLILGSGNIVHNLRRLSFDGKPEAFALEFDDLVTGRLIERDFDTMANREKLGSLLSEAHPSVDHYLPALTIAGASDQRDDLLFMTDSIDLGSISMRSFIFHPR